MPAATSNGSSSTTFRSLLLALLGSLSSGPALAQTDRVVMNNGDILTGEIKSLDRGMLRFETDATDTIEIQWSLVAELTSTQNFQITIDDDRQLFGSLVEPEVECGPAA